MQDLNQIMDGHADFVRLRAQKAYIFDADGLIGVKVAVAVTCGIMAAFDGLRSLIGLRNLK